MGYHRPPMFATLGGDFAPPIGTDDPDSMVRAVVAVQVAAGLEPVTDGGFGGGSGSGSVVERWRRAASIADVAVKAEITGPYSAARATGSSAVAAADVLRAEIEDLAAAGCPLVQVDEDDAVLIGTDERERTRFREAQRRLTEGVDGIHLSLAIRGGSADAAGPEVIFDAPYASYLFDLIAGPDNWRLVARAPGERGIVCGVADARSRRVDSREVMVWAAHYAASTGGRGLARVGLATTGSMRGLPWDAAVAKIEALADAARVAAASSVEEVASALDPRAVDIRSAALGRYAPRRRRR